MAASEDRESAGRSPMKADDVLVSAGAKKRLGPVLGEVCGWLWPEDCQTCGRALAGQRPALGCQRNTPCRNVDGPQ